MHWQPPVLHIHRKQHNCCNSKNLTDCSNACFRHINTVATCAASVCMCMFKVCRSGSDEAAGVVPPAIVHTHAPFQKCKNSMLIALPTPPKRSPQGASATTSEPKHQPQLLSATDAAATKAQPQCPTYKAEHSIEWQDASDTVCSSSAKSRQSTPQPGTIGYALAGVHGFKKPCALIQFVWQSRKRKRVF
jgi:hypothetical protein